MRFCTFVALRFIKRKSICLHRLVMFLHMCEKEMKEMTGSLSNTSIDYVLTRRIAIHTNKETKWKRKFGRCRCTSVRKKNRFTSKRYKKIFGISIRNKKKTENIMSEINKSIAGLIFTLSHRMHAPHTCFQFQSSNQVLADILAHRMSNPRAKKRNPLLRTDSIGIQPREKNKLYSMN